MKRILRWIFIGFASLAGIVMLAAGGVVIASEAIVAQKHPKAQVRLTAATDPGAAARGAVIATVQGCHDCHGDDLRGRLFHEEPKVVNAAGPNLTLAAARQSDADLVRAIRLGVGADGRALWVMPSQSFSHLTDAETADLIAYIRSLEPAGKEIRALELGPIGRIGVVLGKFRPSLASIPNQPLPDYGPRTAQGRELARACTECHGSDLAGANGALKSPDLAMAASYDRADFERLLRTGLAAGDRRLGLMSVSAPKRFNAWTSGQIGELHEYLKARADRQPVQ
jgi:mono/diheme cytochrome c family protein